MTQSSQSQSFASKSSPWAPTQPLLQNILGGLGGVNQGVTPGESSAVSALQGAAGGLPNFGGQVGNVAGGLLGNVPNLNQMVSGAYGQAQGALSPYLSSNYLDPTKTPGMQNVLSTIQQDVGNQIGSMFAGGGRALSGQETQAMARGLAQGEAAPLLNQYNQNVGAQQGAANQLMGGAQGTAGSILGNIGGGANLAAGQSQLATNPALTQLAAAQTAYGLPLSNIGGVEGLTLPIAGLGGQTQGNAQTTSQPSLLQSLGLAGNAFGGSGGLFGALGKGLGFLGV